MTHVYELYNAAHGDTHGLFISRKAAKQALVKILEKQVDEDVDELRMEYVILKTQVHGEEYGPVPS